MTATPTAAPRFSDEQVAELLDLIGDSDSVELKLTVPESEHYVTARALGVDPLGAQIRQVFFFDTPSLTLNRNGLVVRARRVQRKRGGDSIVKVRPVVPSKLPDKLRRSRDFNVEVDAMPGGFVCSGTLKQAVDNAEVAGAVEGDRPLRTLFSKAQRALLSEHAPDDTDLDQLAVLGPILVLKLRFEPEGYDRPLVAELWTYPDNSRVLELSTKCAPGEAFQVAAATRAFLAGRGVDLAGEQQTKTLKALKACVSRITPS
jgi:hypothetical protein